MNATGENEAILTGDSLSFSEFFIFLFLLFSSVSVNDGVFCSFEFLKKKKREQQCGYTCTSTLEFKDAINSRESTFPFFF